MNIIKTNQPNFFGKSGEPVKNGFVYIGQPNQDPESFPKTVTFTDAAGGSFNAQQPLRTNSAGQISYNGKAIIASVSGDYSMRVLDSNSVEVAWIPEIDGDTNGGVDLSDYRRYAPLLADVKQIDVSIGDTAGSFGKTSLTDGNGADWIAVANTGNPANDVTLIDFDNGLQGIIKQVGTDNIKDEAVTSAKIDDNAVTSVKIGASAVTTVKIEDSAVTTAKIANGAVTNDKVPNGALGSEKLQAGAEESAWVSLRYAENPVLEVGAIIFAYWKGSGGPIELGASVAGSTLVPSNSSAALIPYPSLGGSWRCLGRATTDTADSRTTLWQRVS